MTTLDVEGFSKEGERLPALSAHDADLAGVLNSYLVLHPTAHVVRVTLSNLPKGDPDKFEVF